MIRVSLDTVVLLVITVALLIGVRQWVMPKVTERLQSMMVEAVEVK